MGIFKKRKKGVIKEKPSLLLYDYDVVCGAAEEEIPNEFRISQENIPDCRDQKTTGQCAAFSSTNILQILNQLETGERIRFSTTYAYGRHRTKDERDMEGMYVSELMKGMTIRGSVPETYINCLLEVPEAFDYIHNSENLEELDRVAEKYRIQTYVAFKSADKEKRNNEIKRALMKYNIPILGVITEGYAYHAIALIGWDKNKWHYMNSWGDYNGTHDGIDKARYNRLKEAYLMLDAKNAPDFPFEDVPLTFWGYNAIKHCYNSGIIKGVDTTHFSPDSQLTRGHIAQVMYKMAQKYADFEGKKFKDSTSNYNGLPKEHWAYPAARYCANCSIINIYNNADVPLGRDEFCNTIYKFIKTHCSSYIKNIPLINKTPFMDVYNINVYEEAIRACYTYGLIQGVTKDLFMPRKTLTRAEMSQIIYRLVKFIEKYEA